MKFCANVSAGFLFFLGSLSVEKFECVTLCVYVCMCTCGFCEFRTTVFRMPNIPTEKSSWRGFLGKK